MAEPRHIEIERRCEARALKTLVVDDQELNRRVMNLLLQECGCVATLAACGEEAIDYAAAGGFDVIFMDLNMPGLDGDATTRRIRAAGASKASYIVRWTTEPVSWLDGGLYDDQVDKPITLPALARVIAEPWWRALRDDGGRPPARSEDSIAGP
jgi:CheY-like chemotaxis protein